jgi:hypothetical protein
MHGKSIPRLINPHPTSRSNSLWKNGGWLLIRKVAELVARLRVKTTTKTEKTNEPSCAKSWRAVHGDLSSEHADDRIIPNKPFVAEKKEKLHQTL